VAEAEQQTIKFLQQHLQKGDAPMCGHRICQDRRFVANYMRELEAFFHYRNLDVSSLKELARRWKPSVLKGMKKKSSHLALDDIKDSSEELRDYRSKLLDV
jgi:oligoribonuclease